MVGCASLLNYLLVFFLIYFQEHLFVTTSKANMRPIFCGNLEYDARLSDLERAFSRYGKVDRVDMKSGECIRFVPVSLSFWASILLLFLYFINHLQCMQGIRKHGNLPVKKDSGGWFIILFLITCHYEG